MARALPTARSVTFGSSAVGAPSPGGWGGSTPLPDRATCAPHKKRALALLATKRRGKEGGMPTRSEEHTSELQSRENLVCRLLLEKKKKKNRYEEECSHCYS